MGTVATAVRGGIWFAGFSFLSQVFSWFTTIAVARLLVPEDYGLMDMATILTGYFQIFYELGLGSAIVQKKEVNDKELSSVFWFSMFWGLLLAVACFLLANPTAAIYDEPRVIEITRLVSVLFILGPMFIVPRNILHRELRFKAFGFLMSASVLVSCISMIVLAYYGAGVWTLIWGHIIRDFTKVVLSFYFSKWRPKCHFSFSEAKSYLKFGLPVVGTNSVKYVIEKSDIFFGGRAFRAASLGQYSFAQKLAEIPSIKLLTIINNVAYPVFSRFQDNKEEFNKFYLNLIKTITFISMPLYLGGFFLAGEFIEVVLGEKWLLAVMPFKILCIGHLLLAISSPNNIANMAQGRPQLGFYVNLIGLPFIVLGFYLCAKYGDIVLLALPWAVVVPLVNLVFTKLTLNYLGISIGTFLRNLFPALLASVVMFLSLFLFQLFFENFFELDSNKALYLISAIVLGSVVFIGYLFTFQKVELQKIFSLLNSKEVT